MTREDAITTLEKIQKLLAIYPKRKKQKESVNEIDTAIGMAIEALQREEAEEKGWCHRIRPKNVEVVVRCKDCKYWQGQEVGIVECSICTRIHDMVFEMGADGFCSKGERKGGDSE